MFPTLNNLWYSDKTPNLYFAEVLGTNPKTGRYGYHIVIGIQDMCWVVEV